MANIFDNGIHKDNIIKFQPPFKLSLTDWYDKAEGRKAIVSEDPNSRDNLMIYYIAENSSYNYKVHKLYMSKFNNSDYDLLTGVDLKEGVGFIGGSI